MHGIYERKHMKRVITLLTDFGVQDGYVGTMKGVIHTINPRASVVDLSHEVSPHDILEAAYILYSAYRYFPAGTVHLIVVDPGVGSPRRIVGMMADDYIFIAPDNGVLTFIIQRADVKEIFEITNEKYFLKPISDTFHGRDIFAPVAAHLSKGVALAKLGGRIGGIKKLKIVKPRVTKEGFCGEVIHIDRFGNLITNIDRKLLEEFKVQISKFKVKVGTEVIFGISKSYADVETGKFLAIFGSSGFLEISVSQGNASKVLGVERGQKVEVQLTKSQL